MVYVKPSLASYVGADNPYVLGTYHPYRQGNNPKFDDYSGLILDFKRGGRDAINEFKKRVDRLLRSNICIVTFPSHDPENMNSSIETLGHLLSAGARTDGTRCLKRHTWIDKQANGGKRSVDRHVSTIHVHNVDLLAGKPVLLLDDVTTTGRSLKAGEYLLKDAGVSKVYCLALAKTAYYGGRDASLDPHTVSRPTETQNTKATDMQSPFDLTDDEFNRLYDGYEGAHHPWDLDEDDFRLSSPR